MYFIGIDNSAKYSRLAAIDADKKVLGHHIGNSANLNVFSRDIVRDNLKKLILEFNRLTNTKFDDCGGICIGASCVSGKEYAVEMEQVLNDLGMECPVKAVNEMDLVLAAECLGQPGIVIYSGTDSIAYAVDKNNVSHRIGGYGHLIDSGGSGYWIGIQAIKHSIMAYDGRIQGTSLADRIQKSFRINEISKIIEFIYSDKFNKAVISELAHIVKSAAAEGDATAIEIENKAAEDLFLLARAMIERHQLSSGNIILCGPMLQANESLRKKTTGLIIGSYSSAIIFKLSKKLEIGAAYIAYNLGGGSPA